MRIRSISLLTFAFLLGCKSKPVIPSAKSNKTLLWEVSGNGLKSPAYFLGTMHLMCAKDAFLSNNVRNILKEVEQVYLEADMDNAAELLSGVLDIAMHKGASLKDLLTEPEYNRVKAFYTQYQPNVPFEVTERQHPLMISAGLYELLLPCEKKNGIELEIIEVAYKLKKETKGLETLAFQASLLNDIPYDLQAKSLVNTIDSLPEYRRSMQQMIDVYKSQDIERLYALTLEEDSAVNGSLEILLYKRNRNWVSQFDTIAAQKKTLFAVGAGHLGGEQGVLQLLKKKGYTLRPLVN